MGRRVVLVCACLFVCANAQKLRALGWKPRYDLRSGLENTIAWWKANA